MSNSGLPSPLLSAMGIDGWELRREDGAILVSKPGVGSYCAEPDDGNMASEILYHLANYLLTSPLGGYEDFLAWMREVEQGMIQISGMQPTREMANAVSALRQKVTQKKWVTLQNVATSQGRNPHGR